MASPSSDATITFPPRVSSTSNDDPASTPKARQDQQQLHMATNSPPAHVKDGKLSNDSDFRRLFAHSMYADKTEVIAEFMKDNDKNVHLLLRPRRSGKSTTVSTMKYFFEFDPKTQVDRHRTLTYPWPAAIMDKKHEQFVEQNFAQHPVLHLNMSDFTARGTTERSVFQSFGSNICDEVDRLRRLGRLKEADLEQRDKDMLENLSSNEPREDMICRAPKRLTQLLHEETGREVIVLIDEYDHPLYNAHPSLFRVVENLLRGMYERLLKDNPHISGAFIVGVLRVAKSGFLSGLNNVKVFPLHSRLRRYATACMFTGEEVKVMFAKHKDRNPSFPLKLHEAKDWYNGYSCALAGVELWNPWSVINAMQETQLTSYWSLSGSDTIIVNIFCQVYNTCEDELGGLLNGERRTILYRDTLDYEMLQGQPSAVSKEDLFGLLLYGGYLTAVNTQDPEVITEPAVEEDNASGLISRNVRIPNKEVRRAFHSWIQTIAQRQMKHDPVIQTIMTDIFTHLCDGNGESLRIQMELVLSHLSCFSIVNEEAYYTSNIFLLLRFAINPGAWEISTEQESGTGRSDISMYERFGKKGIVIELKQTRTPDGLEGATQRALHQIHEKNYVGGFPHHISEGWIIGMAFHKRMCRVKVEKFSRDGS